MVASSSPYISSCQFAWIIILLSCRQCLYWQILKQGKETCFFSFIFPFRCNYLVLLISCTLYKDEFKQQWHKHTKRQTLPFGNPDFGWTTEQKIDPDHLYFNSTSLSFYNLITQGERNLSWKTHKPFGTQVLLQVLNIHVVHALQVTIRNSAWDSWKV